jgi:hypothetical protein
MLVVVGGLGRSSKGSWARRQGGEGAVRSLGDGVVGRGWVHCFLLTLPLWSVVSGELGREGLPLSAVV